MNAQVVAAIIAASVSVLTLIGTLAAQYLGRRATSRDTERTLTEQSKQLDRTLAEQREQLDKTLAEQREQLDRTLAEQRTRTLNERFATAADQLGSDKPPAVRLAGVYAMAGLADDWPVNRQTCVDVLCAYLRLPYDPDPGDEADPAAWAAYRANGEVRYTVIRLIGAHLRDGAAVSWQGLNFDFTGVIFDGGSFSGARFSGGEVSFRQAEFSGGEVSFRQAEFSGGEVSFYAARFRGSTVDFSGAGCSGGEVSFRRGVFSGGTVDFDAARFSGGTVSFRRCVFSGGTVTFRRCVFSGGTVDFSAAGFSGGTVDFTSPGAWIFPPRLPWTDRPPPGVKLPKKEDQSQA
jgi:uncharacterized protein YjbI with pentapeptide repeats